MQLNDAGVLITGGSLGIGKAAAKRLVAAGARVAITGRDAARLEAAAKETGAHPIVADAGNQADVDRTWDEFDKQIGRLDCLVNNAGIGRFGELGDITREDFEKVFAVNVFGAAMMAQAAVPRFKKTGRGAIINVGSTSAEKGFKAGTVYSSSKFALRGMTQCWQAELRPHDIRVMLLDPSEVATAFGDSERRERTAPPNKLTAGEIAYVIQVMLELDDRGMIPQLTVWATNPW